MWSRPSSSIVSFAIQYNKVISRLRYMKIDYICWVPNCTRKTQSPAYPTYLSHRMRFNLTGSRSYFLAFGWDTARCLSHAQCWRNWPGPDVCRARSHSSRSTGYISIAHSLTKRYDTNASGVRTDSGLVCGTLHIPKTSSRLSRNYI